MLFTDALSSIGFEDIENFCHAFQEGVRVEYKAQIANVPKVV